MAHFFIDRPVFAWVIAIIIMLAGAIAVINLPVSMYPPIAPPAVEIRASYPGASAEVVENSVTQIIEQNLTGLDGLLYFSSTSSSNGSMTISLTFETGTDPDTAQVQVQNQVQVAMPQLPQIVQQQGVRVNKSRTGFLQVLGFISAEGRMERADIADYVSSNLEEPLSRVPGVGRVQVFGAKYAMRIWLNPEKLDTYKLSPNEVINAVRGQNAQVAVGQLGGAPSIIGQEINATINAQDRLQTPEQFRDIVIRANTDGSTLRLGDIAKVELGAESYDFNSRYNGRPATGVAISLASDANALATAKNIADLIEEMRPFFPEDLQVVIPFDTTPFVRISIEGVVKTLIEAIALVFLVMYLFLQNFRATIIPTIAVPVVLLGTFGILSALGFSINMLTMFAMVLAIGLLVDDAIVVVENVERIMVEEGLSPLEATRKSMDQITGALVGIGLVLSAVFVPMAFMTGSTGVIYRQFSATIVSAMALSVLVAIILTPSLCATMLKPKKEVHTRKGFFGLFNRGFDASNSTYRAGVKGILLRPARFMLLFTLLAVFAGWSYMRMPTSFVPGEDQGILMSMVTAPVGSTQQRTLESIEYIEDHFLNNEDGNVVSVFAIQGFSFSGIGQHLGMAFIKLKDWDERPDPAQSAGAVAMRAMGAWQGLKDAMTFTFPPPAMPELGVAAGFSFFLKDNGGQGHQKLLEARNMLLGMAMQSPKLKNVRPNGQEDTPQFRIEIDNAKAASLGLAMSEINSTLSTAWGASYIDDFINRGRVKKVYMQAEAPYRMNPEDLLRWSVKNNQGEMVPFSAFATTRWDFGSPRLERFNGVAAMEVQGEAADGVSSGEAMEEIERLISQLPPGFGADWSGLSYQERQAGSQAPLLYTLSVLVVFLSLAALYESWSVPTAVMLVAPLGILGTVLANTMRGMEQDIYFQVAMLATIGLTSKNAILIVEFAKAYLEEGAELIEATMHAVRDRLRPIIMTSLAFGLGVLPLALATGAGSGAQRAIGTGVLGGMLVGTLLGIFFTPLFFVVIQKIFGKKPQPMATSKAS